MSEGKGGSAGIGLCGLIFIVFLVLKLTEIGMVAKWSWWWVTSPLWIPFCIILILAVIAAVIGGFLGANKS